jgi:two-component system cell cycle response regulator DivK
VRAYNFIALSRARILLVDDYEVNRDLYREYLSFCGFDVVEARNGSEAIELAFANRPDLIVMDLGMPLLDGWAATKLLKSDGRTRNVPIVVVSGFTQQRHEQAARQAGADAFLPKPCLGELVKEVGRLLR